MRGAALAAVALLCAGCAITPPKLPASAANDQDAFAVSGRFAVRYGKEGGSGRLDWQHTSVEDELTVRNPLGSVIAMITRENGVYSLAAPDRETQRATDPDTLTERALGWRLPLRGLPYWVRGRPAPDLPQVDARDGDPSPNRLHQAGWTIEYLSRHPDSGLPERLNLSRDDLQIRLILDDWRR